MASVNGTSGNDSISTGADNDSIDAGAGDDTVYSGAGSDSIEGGDGYDKIHGGDGNDTISGGAGDSSYDDLYGGAGDDWIITSDGDENWVYGGDGADTVYGGAQTDEVYGGNDDDALSGNGGDDTLFGDAGEDSLYGGAGSDRIFAGDDDDLIQGEEGDDTLFGGAGDDTFKFMDTAGTDTVNGDAGQNQMTFFASTDATITYTGNAEGMYSQNGGATSGSFQNIQSINTAGGHDTIDGSADGAGLTVSSGSGDDTVTGGTGNDSLDGGSGNDTISGGVGDDTLFGGQGDDLLYGGDGNDEIYGGAGDDTIFVGDGDDVVFGFEIPAVDGDEIDQLDVSGLQNPDGSPVKVGNVSVVDDGSGNAKLIFPEGETVVLTGVSPAQMSTSAQLHAAGIPCFTPGAMIATNMGERAIETLSVGDLVFTRDHGLQPIRWIGQRTVAAQGDFAPIRIEPGVILGQSRPLLVSPQHRFLFQGYRAELLFGESEVFVAAKHLVDGRNAIVEPAMQVTYLHMLFDHHEVVFANNAATESFHPGEQAIGAVDSAARAELFDLFPHLRADLTQYGTTARRALKKHEAMMVRQ